MRVLKFYPWREEKEQGRRGVDSRGADQKKQSDNEIPNLYLHTFKRKSPESFRLVCSLSTVKNVVSVQLFANQLYYHISNLCRTEDYY